MKTALLPPAFTLLQVTPRLDGGGVERATLDIAGAAAAAGARSLVASEGGALEAQLAAMGSQLVRLPVASKSPWVMWKNAARLARLVAREEVSLMHVRSRAPAFSALRAARMAGVPLVATYHGIYAARSPWKRWYNGVMTRGDLVIANSAFTRDHIAEQHPRSTARIAVVPEGIDTEFFDPGAVSAARVSAVRDAWGLAAHDERPVLLVAARLTGWKGQRLAIEALARLTDPGGPWLILAGKPESDAYARELVTLAARLGVGDQVRLVGAMADMPAAYLAADLTLAPSQLAESFGRGVVEAGAMERLVIASALGAHLETIVAGETGWFARTADIEAWAVAIQWALSLPRAQLDKMGAAARERVVRLYDLKVMCAATFDLYRRLGPAA